MGVIILIGIAVLVLFTSIISSSGKLIDRRRKGVRKITKTGWKIVILNVIVITLSVFQFYLNENELKERDIVAEKKLEVRDSILKSNYDSSLLEIKEKFDTSNLETIITISQTLGKYGYLLDSNQKILTKIIKDSTKT